MSIAFSAQLSISNRSCSRKVSLSPTGPNSAASTSLNACLNLGFVSRSARASLRQKHACSAALFIALPLAAFVSRSMSFVLTRLSLFAGGIMNLRNISCDSGLLSRLRGPIWPESRCSADLPPFAKDRPGVRMRTCFYAFAHETKTASGIAIGASPRIDACAGDASSNTRCSISASSTTANAPVGCAPLRR